MQTNSEKPLNKVIIEFKNSSVSGKIFTAFFLFVPLAVVAYYLNFLPIFTFFISAFAVIPLARAMSKSTEALAHYLGAAIGGLLIATFGNAVELIIAVVALTQGLNEVVKASITGSIIGNTLLVLGLSMFIGGLKRSHQVFNRVAASANASQLTLAAIALIVPAVFTTTLGVSINENRRNELLENLSLLVAAVLLLSYVGQLFFFLRPHPGLTADEGVTEQQKLQEESAAEGPHWSKSRALITLVVATVVVGLVSEILVSSIEPLTKQFGWTELFVGVVLVAIIGNAAEYLSAISAAKKNNMNLALGVAIGSSLQIAFFVVPALVFAGFFLNHQLTLNFEPFELISIVLAILIVNRVSSDGESNWFEGMQLIAAYLIIAIAFFLHV